MVLLHENVVGLDSAIFMHPTIWKASGHVDAFNDPLIDNKDSKKKAKVSEDKRSVEYSREEIESLLPNLAGELARDQYNPLEIISKNLEGSPRFPDEIKKATEYVDVLHWKKLKK